MLAFTLAISYLITSNLHWFVDLSFQVPMQYCFLHHRRLLPSPVTSTTACCFCFFSVSSFFLKLFLHWCSVAYWGPTDLGVYLSLSYLFAFSYCSWGSQGKNTEVVCHSLLQWTPFCQTSPPYPPILGCPVGMAWFHWVRQGCGPSVIRLTSFLWLWFQCVCPLMPSCNTYHLTWVSLTLGVGYLFTAAPAKHSCCSLPWTRGISSQPPLLTLNVE